MEKPNPSVSTEIDVEFEDFDPSGADLDISKHIITERTSKLAFQSEDKAHGYVDEEYRIEYDKRIPHLSSEFAVAHPCMAKGPSVGFEMYALVFEKKFPIRMDALTAMRRAQSSHLVKVFSFGKAFNPQTKAEAFAVILEKPPSLTLSEYMLDRKRLDEKIITRRLLDQFLSAIQPFSLVGAVHGRINPDNIYFDKTSGRMVLGECLSDFCGYSQNPAYESLNMLLCHDAAKDTSDLSADYFSLGMIVLFLYTGNVPFENMGKGDILDWRLQHGSSDAVMKRYINEVETPLSRRNDSLLRGLLTDSDEERWGLRELRSWLRMEDVMVQASKVHKESSNAFAFDGKEYYSAKYLAYDLHKKWPVAKRSLRIGELVRWMNLGLKRPDAADVIELLVPNPNQEVILSDEKLARIIITLDPGGPIRYHSFASSIHGLGPLLTYTFIQGDRELLQHFGFIFSDGLVQYWINQQKNPDTFTFGVLGWSPIKVRQNMRRNSLGFGMERTLYDLSRSLACQSKLVENAYAVDLKDLLIALDGFAGDKTKTDPIDRHVAAFIASRIGLVEEMTIRALKSYPSISKNPQVHTLGLLTVAQNESGAPPLHNLSEWMIERLTNLYDLLHGKSIRNEVKVKLKKASRTGRLKDMYFIIAAPTYIKRDHYALKKARREYHQLSQVVHHLKRKSTIQKMAYRSGLRVAVNVAYSVLSVTIFYILLTL